MKRKYPLPAFLIGTLNQKQYSNWLHRKAVQHVRRDRNRGNSSATNECYKIAIHKAVMESDGYDCYTGEMLNWSLVGTYANSQSQQEGRKYKATLALLPTVDHVNDGLGPADFRICSWRTNDAKNDLTFDEFFELCKTVIRYNGGEGR